MDEVEKYQQRLQAIAEKRRLQEEEERAKRQLEDEKLRLQQLKRKSLRDQWLMEGPPPNSAGPRSPLWGTQPQQIEAHIDKLQTDIIDRTHKHKEVGPTSAQSHADHHGNESVNAVTPPPSGSSVNGQEKSSDTSHDTFFTNSTAPHPESHNAPLQHINDISKGVETLLFLGYTEAEPGQGDDDDVSAVIRAERVIITEEGEEVTQDTPAEEEEVEEREEGGEEKEEEREKGQEEEKEEEREKERELEREKEREEEREEGGEEKEEKREKGQEKEKEEERELEREKEREEEREKETEEEREVEREVEREEEQGEEREIDCKEESAADVENHLEKWTEADELTELKESLNNNTHVDSLNQDTKVTTSSHTDDETSADADTHLVRDSATNSALNTDLISDADLAAVSELETPGGAIQTPFGPRTLSASALNPNYAQKSPSHASTTTHAAAQFQEIPLGGATVEEEPLLATKVEPLRDATNRNQAEGAKTKTCQCCMIM